MRFWLVLMLLSGPAVAQEVTGTAGIEPRHLLILKPGLDAVFGNYVFAVANPTDAEVELEIPVALPLEADDFLPEEGATKDEVTYTEVGSRNVPVVKKKFAPGTQLVSFRFRAPASSGTASLTLQPQANIGNLTVLYDKSGIDVEGEGLEVEPSSLGMAETYKAKVLKNGVAAGKSYVVQVIGLPSGRKPLWILGSVAAGVLVLLGAMLAWRTRPKIEPVTT
jgi:hypothetical protein